MSPEIVQLIAWSTLDTLIMVGLSGLLGTLFGLPLGVFLATSRANELFPSPAANRILGLIVNATRSTPFIILVVAIVPLTRLIVGTSIGTRAAVVPLTIAAIPFIGRVVEAAIREVDQGLVEAARPGGARTLQNIAKGFMPEALPALTLALTLTLVSLLGYSAMVGAVGGGGLGDLGIRYGYQRFMPEVMAAVVIVLIVLVQGVQSLGETIARRLDKRSRNS
jgi:D-methionine transport system permease protein